MNNFSSVNQMKCTIGKLGSDATKGDCNQVKLVCWPRSIHVPYVFSCTSNVSHFNGTLRYTNFPSNLALSTVCLRQIFLAQNKCFNFFNFVSSSSRARTAGKTFRSSSTINLGNNLIQSTTRPAFMRKLLKIFLLCNACFEINDVIIIMSTI